MRVGHIPDPSGKRLLHSTSQQENVSSHAPRLGGGQNGGHPPGLAAHELD